MTTTAWEELQNKQLLMAYGLPKELAGDLLRRHRLRLLVDGVRVASIMRAWGVGK